MEDPFTMSISMGHRLHHSVQIAQSLRLSKAIRVQIQGRALQLRLGLIGALRGEQYTPRGTCPSCGRKMTALEIIKGFNTDPNDFSTLCSGCNTRFQPQLVCFGNGSSLELPFWCDCQTLYHLQGKETMSPEKLMVEHPAIYRSAIVHHGGIKQAFAKNGVAYPFKEISDWKSKVGAFLGKLPDTVIAECASVSVRAVRKVRNDLGIARYTVKVAVMEIEAEA